MQHSYAQKKPDLTGRWEGTMDNGEHLTICMKLKKNELCGYTADYELRDPASHCKANFKGWYDGDERMWVLMGTDFIENSGGHVLMIVRLGRQPGDDINTLHGTVEIKYAARSVFGLGGDRDGVQLKRVSTKLPADMPDCFPKETKSTTAKKEATIKTIPKNTKPVVPAPKPVVKKPVTPKPTPPKPKPVSPAPKPVIIKKDTTKLIRVDTAKKIIKPAPLPVPKDQSALVRKMNARKNTEFSRIVVHTRNITLNVYDNGIVDNDTVSIFYNGKLIAGKKGLSEKPFTIKLELDEDAPTHEIVMFAENLGTIPPNTALIVVTVDGKRYELHSSASLTENAVLRFEYKPN
ncbi:MAG: hypothetical protein QM737_22245 [Ferruginibacter sp.]